MSDGWQAYITSLMESSSAITKAAIIGSGDGSLWANSPTFKASPEELQKLAKHFNNLNDLPAHGLHLEGVKYIVPRTEENLIFGKQGKTGLFAVKTTMAVVIACFEGETEKGQECRTAVEKMGQYLQSSGY